MKDIIMTHIQTERPQTARLLIKFGATMALAISTAIPLQAQDTVVEGKVQRSDVVERKVGYADLNLREQPNQLILISRVKKAAGEVCDILYRGEAPILKFHSRCPQTTYKNAKPQIDLAIANAQNGKRVAISLVVARSR